MKKSFTSCFSGIIVVLLCVAEFVSRMNGGGHVIFRMSDRPFSIPILVLLLGLVLWAQKTKRVFVRNLALTGCVFVIL
jgi:hypothetical protein